MRPMFYLGLLALLPTLGYADYCADRAAAAFGELTQALGSAPAGTEETEARAVLERLCRDAQGAAAGRAGAPTTQPGPDASASTSAAAAATDAPPAEQTEPAKEPKSTRIFGVEIKQAPEGAAGYERASKSP